MSKLQSWERDDAMHDYIKWQEELERLQAECPDDLQGDRYLLLRNGHHPQHSGGGKERVR